MCGIVGYIGNKKATPILINGLLRLEYRGYDSAGISTIEKEGLSVMKDKGRVKNLNEINGIDKLEGTIGIAHTRWATHGKPSKENSHPHMDNSKSFSVVHNGIIENYNELRKFLNDKNYKFYSDTDTEVIPNLIHYYYSKDTNNDEKKLLRAVKNTCLDLKGSFAIEVISKYYPENMIVVRKDSPLVIGTCQDENYISSDIPAILSFTRNFYLLNDLEFVLLSKNDVKFFDKNLKEFKKEIKTIEWNASAAEKDGFEDFMLKEIYEQPTAIRETIGSRLPENSKIEFDELKFTKEYLSSLNKIYIVACGSAWHVGMAAQYVLEDLADISVRVELASEFRYRKMSLNPKALMIVVSQSGETADTLAALRLAKEKGITTMAIVNVVGSSIAREADNEFYPLAGPEISVATTKAYSAQLAAMYCLAVQFAKVRGKITEEQYGYYIAELLTIPEKVQKILEDKERLQWFAAKYANASDVFFVGRGIDYAVCPEGSLKLKEISYIHSEAYAAGELKHGTISLIEQGPLVIGALTQDELYEKTISNMLECKSRGAYLMGMTTYGNYEIEDQVNFAVYVPKVDEHFMASLAVIPLQLLGYYVSVAKGLDVDKPRNLAKSVTVE